MRQAASPENGHARRSARAATASSARWRTSPAKNSWIVTVQQLPAICHFEQVQPFGIDIGDAAVQGEDLHAVACALHDPLVEFLGLTKSPFAPLPLGNVRVAPGHPDGRALFVANQRTTRAKPPDAAIAMNHPVLICTPASAVDVRLGLFQNGCRIIGMPQSAPVVQMVADFVILVPNISLSTGSTWISPVARFQSQNPTPPAAAARRCWSSMCMALAASVSKRDGVGDGCQQFDIVERLGHRRGIGGVWDVASEPIAVTCDEDDGSRRRLVA